MAFVLALFLLALGSARAEDSAPPCWRGAANTTYQSWVFTASNNPAIPEAFANSNGAPSASMTIGAFGKGWLATSFGGKTGLWELGRAGQVALTVSNLAGFSGAPKYVQVQVTYFEDTLAYRPPVVSIVGATLISVQTVNNSAAPPGNWRTQITTWQIFPAPTSETILINGDAARGLLIDQIVVDTRITAGGDGDVPGFQPCWRGLAGSTFQHWTFGMSNNPASLSAELATNSFGVPAGAVALGPFSSGYILEVSTFFGCRQGIWDLGQSGTMSFNIPNDPSGTPGSYKYVQVAVTQLRDGIYAENATVSIPGGTLVNQQEQTVETSVFGESWVVAKSLWRLGPPCPGSETVTLIGGTNGSLIDQVVVDTMCVNLPCPADILANSDAGQCGKSNVMWSVPATGCVVTNVVCVPALGSTFPVGTNLVTCVAYDLYGGTRTCNFTVTVLDSEPPVISCPANIVVARDPSQCGAIVNFSPLASDNCSGTLVNTTPASGSLFPLGITTVTAVAYDAASNASTPCQFTVQVMDLTGDVAIFQPCWRGEPDTTFQQWAFSISNNPAAVIPELTTNAFGTAQISIVPGAFSSGYLDQYAFLGCRQGIWDLGFLGTMTATIPNVPAAPASAIKYVQVAVTQYRDDIYAQNAAVSISGGTLVSQEQQGIETNTFGGIWTVEKTIWRLGPPAPGSETIVLTGGTNGSLIDQVVVDTLTRDFPCPGDFIAGADLGQCSKSNVTWTLPALDGCLVTNIVSVPPNGATFAVGTNPVTSVVYDRYGGATTCNFSVVINDTQPPNAVCKNITVNLDGVGNVSIVGADVDDGSTDNCGIASLAVSPNSFTCANLGPNAVTLTVTDVHGLVSVCNATVTVVDTLPPSFVCPAAVTNNADVGVCTATFALPALLASDNCGVSLIYSNAPVSFPAGVTPVTWTVVDVNGNTNSCVQLVVIQDIELPQIVCPDDIVTNATTDCSQVVTWTTPMATDNCTVTNVTFTPPSGSTFPVGMTTVLGSVWDASGHSNGCTFAVTVNASADLVVTMTASPDPVLLGSNVIYSVTVSNAGPCTATDVIVSNLLSVGQVGLMSSNAALVGLGDPNPGPVAWWPAGGNPNDAAGGNHGTVAGGVVYAAGTVGQAFDFDGTSGSVTVPDAPALRPASITIEGWIKIQDVTGVHVVIGKRLGAATVDSYSMWIGSGVLFASIGDSAGAGPFLTYPEFPTYSTFRASDLVDLQSFAYKLQPASPADLVSWFIKTNLSPATTVLLAAYSGGPDATLQKRLIQDLNDIISNGSIYDPIRFGAVTLSPESQYILGRNPLGPDLVRLNRFLVRDAYPAEFASTVFPQLNQWFHIAYTFDAGSQVQALYVNGTLVNLGFVSKQIEYDSHPLLIGADDDNGSPGYFYQGTIDELALYDRALTGAEVQGIYAAESGGKNASASQLAIGNLPAGTVANVAFVAMPTNCPVVSATATALSATTELVPANNTTTAAVTVQELPASEWLLSLERVSPNNNLLRITWPLACDGLELETTTNLVPPITWLPANLPVQLINQRQTTIAPAADEMRYFRAKTP